MGNGSPVVVVTGASRGIGAATGSWLGRMGASVILTGRSREGLELVAAEVEATGSVPLVVSGDLRQKAVQEEIVQATLSKFGPLDGILSNVGSLYPIDPLSTADLTEWREAYELQVTAPLSLIQRGMPALRESHARVVITNTEVATAPIIGLGAYTCSKAACLQMARELALKEPEEPIGSSGEKSGLGTMELGSWVLLPCPVVDYPDGEAV